MSLVLPRALFNYPFRPPIPLLYCVIHPIRSLLVSHSLFPFNSDLPLLTSTTTFLQVPDFLFTGSTRPERAYSGFFLSWLISLMFALPSLPPTPTHKGRKRKYTRFLGPVLCFFCVPCPPLPCCNTRDGFHLMLTVTCNVFGPFFAT